MATKPIIANPRGEYDARSLVLADQAQVNPWPDVSPAANNDLASAGGFAAYQAVGGVGTPWSDTLPAVRMDAVPGPIDVFSFPIAFGGSGTAITLFVVAEATDLAGSGMAFWGTTDGINPPVGVYLFIAPDGSVWFSLGADGGTSGSNTRTGPGVVSPGDRVIITARRLDTPQMVGVSSGPTIIRVNGIEVASDLSSGWVDFWFNPRMHRCNMPSTGIFPGSVDGDDGLYAHLLAYQEAASDTQIDQMEAFLAEVWGVQFGTIWIPNPLPVTPEPVFPPAPKPEDLDQLRPIVEFDVRFLTDEGLEYQDGDSVKENDGGEGWKDLFITDPQGRTDAGLIGAQGDGNILFVKNGWNEKRGIDAVRFVGDPVSAPVEAEGNFIGWPGGGPVPEDSNWIGNEYTYIGVMRCTDISQFCCLFGKVSGVTPVNGNPIATGVWVQPDGSVAVHHTDEETGGAVQPGSVFSLESEPGIVKAGDSIIITVTHSSLFGVTRGKTLRVNGKVVARNVNAIRNLQQMSAPALGSHFPQQDGNPGNPGVVCGLDKLIVYFAAFGTLLTEQTIREYEAFLALTFQVSIGTQWKFDPLPVPDETPWFPEQPAPAQPVIANQVIELDSRPDLPDPPLDPPGEPNRFGTWPDTSGNGVDVSNGAAPTQPIWEEQGWDPNGRRLGVVSFRDIQEHMNVFDGGFGLGYPGNRVTLFFVVEVTDISTDPIVVIGGNDNRNLRNLNVIITTAGAVEFNYFDEVPLTGDDTTTADGLVSQGDLIQITCRAGAGGRIIRVNGVEEGSSVGTGQLITYPTMFISNFRFLQGASMKLAWYSGHNAEATDAEILEMEAFLRGAFFTADPPPPTPWAP